jgi:hypothetical protein
MFNANTIRYLLTYYELIDDFFVRIEAGSVEGRISRICRQARISALQGLVGVEGHIHSQKPFVRISGLVAGFCAYHAIE